MKKFTSAFLVSACIFMSAGCASVPSDRAAITGPLPAKYTGLAIDARGLGLRTALIPKLLVQIDAEFREIYGGDKCDPEIERTSGVVGYAGSLKEALERDRVGDNPLVVRAIMTDQIRTGAVVSPADAQLIFTAEKENGFFKKCRVIFIIDK